MAKEESTLNIPLWLFLGPEVGNKNDEIKKLCSRAKSELGEIDEDYFYAHETSVPELLGLLQNGSLFSAGRFVVFRGAESIKKKEDIAMLTDWAHSLAEKKSQNDSFSWLILVSDESSVDKKLEAIIPKQNKKIFWEMFENQKNEWLKNWFDKEGFFIEADAIDTILELIENNTETLRNECSRFSLCLEKGHRICVEDVETILSHSREESPFTLFASLCDTDKNTEERFSSALSILQHIRNSKESSYFQLIAALSHCFRRLKVWHVLHTEKPYPSDLDLKIKGFSSKKMQGQYASAAKIWSIKETILCLSMLSQTDMIIRTTGNMVEEIVLQELLYSLIVKKGRELQVYSA